MKFLLAVALLASSALASFYEQVALSPEAELAGLGPDAAPLVGDVSNAMGTARVIYNSLTRNLYYNIEFSGLTSNVVAAHFHGPAGPNAVAGVQLVIDVPMGGTMMPLAGNVTLSEGQEMMLLSSQWYINLHTEMNPMTGEIRGNIIGNQVNIYQTMVPLSTDAVLAGNGGVPPFADLIDIANAAGNSIVLYTPSTGQVDWMVAFNDLSSEATLGHFHGLAGPNATAGVIATISGVAFMSPHVGSATIELMNREGFFRGGMSYINIHTADNGAGELRGQVVNFQLIEADPVMTTTMMTMPPQTANPDQMVGSAASLSTMAALALSATAAVLAQ